MKGGVAPMGVGGIETSSRSPPNSSIVPKGACNLKLLSESSDESSSSLDFLRPVPILIATKPPPSNHHIQRRQLIEYTNTGYPPSSPHSVHEILLFLIRIIMVTSTVIEYCNIIQCHQRSCAQNNEKTTPMHEKYMKP